MVISGSTKVVDFGTNRKRVYDILLVINSNLCRISHRQGRNQTSIKEEAALPISRLLFSPVFSFRPLPFPSPLFTHRPSPRVPFLLSFPPCPLPLEVGPSNAARGWRSAVSSHSGVWGGAPAEIEFSAF